MLQCLLRFSAESFQATKLYNKIMALENRWRGLDNDLPSTVLTSNQHAKNKKQEKFIVWDELQTNDGFEFSFNIDVLYRTQWKLILSARYSEFFQTYFSLLNEFLIAYIEFSNLFIHSDSSPEVIQCQYQKEEITKILCLFKSIKAPSLNNYQTFLSLQNQFQLGYEYFTTKLEEHKYNQFRNIKTIKAIAKRLKIIHNMIRKLREKSSFFQKITQQKILKNKITAEDVHLADQKMVKSGLKKLIDIYVDHKQKQYEICYSCQKYIAFSKMQKHLKGCKQRYDNQEYIDKIDSQINAKSQDINSVIAAVKKIKGQKQKELEKKNKEQKPKSKYQRGKDIFAQRNYKTSVFNKKVVANQFEQDQDSKLKSDSEDTKPNKKPARKIEDLNLSEMNIFLKLIDEMKNVTSAIKNQKLSKKSELYQSLKSIKQSTKINLDKLNVHSPEIIHLMMLLLKRAELVVRQRKYQLQGRQEEGYNHNKFFNFTNLEYENFKSHQFIQIEGKKNKNKFSEDYFSQDQSTPRSNASMEINQVRLSDFKILRLLGKGKYGEVFLVKKKQTGIRYALKKIFVENSKNYTEISSLKTEHDVFQIVSSPFIVKALYSFTQKDFHYFVMEYLPNGDFAELLEQQERLYESQARLPLAQIVMALQHLHDHDIIHRDIKPQNIVIDTNGNLKITDFGLSESGLLKRKCQEDLNRSVSNFMLSQIKKKRKNNDQTLKKIVGSPYFMAPQILKGQEITRMADWWSFGILMFQTLVGVPAFTGNSFQNIRNNILSQEQGFRHWPAEIQFGYDQQSNISYQAKDLIEKLLTLDATKRIGLDVEDIKTHPFFQGIEWDKLNAKPSPILQLIEQKDQEQQIEQQGYSTDQQCKKSSSFVSTTKSIKFYRRDILTSETKFKHRMTAQKYAKLKDFASKLSAL